MHDASTYNLDCDGANRVSGTSYSDVRGWEMAASAFGAVSGGVPAARSTVSLRAFNNCGVQKGASASICVTHCLVFDCVFQGEDPIEGVPLLFSATYGVLHSVAQLDIKGRDLGARCRGDCCPSTRRIRGTRVVGCRLSRSDTRQLLGILQCLRRFLAHLCHLF